MIRSSTSRTTPPFFHNAYGTVKRNQGDFDSLSIVLLLSSVVSMSGMALSETQFDSHIIHVRRSSSSQSALPGTNLLARHRNRTIAANIGHTGQSNANRSQY